MNKIEGTTWYLLLICVVILLSVVMVSSCSSTSTKICTRYDSWNRVGYRVECEK